MDDVVRAVATAVPSVVIRGRGDGFVDDERASMPI